MESKPYDVVLIPDEAIAESSIILSKNLSHLDSLFVLDNKNFFPHMSLYMLQIKKSSLEEVFQVLSSIAPETHSWNGVAKKYNYENNYLDVEYNKDQTLINLQEKILTALNGLRDGIRENDKERLQNATGETRENILKYGYRSIGNLFFPHLTFTRFKDNNEDIIDKLPEKSSFNAKFAKLGLFEMGENGTCIKEVRTWDLK